MSLDMTSFDAALKQLYLDSNEVMKNLVYKNQPFLSLVPKFEDFGGRNMPIPLIYANPQGRSAVFSTAQTNATNSSLKAFLITRQHDYGVAQIDNETLEASEGNQHAFMEAVTVEIDGILHAVGRSLGTSLYRSGSGSIGQVQTSSFAVTTCTLTNAEDIVNFEVGMKIVTNNTDDATSVNSGTLTINGVDRVAGTFTTTANLSTGIASIAQYDYIFVEGDPGAKVKGLMAWMPASVTATSFFGVDRTADRVRLGGNYVDGSALPIEEALIQGAVRAAREGGMPDHCFMSFKSFDALCKSLGTKVQYITLESPVGISFSGIQVNGPHGAIKVVPDVNCPSAHAFMLQLDSWLLASLGKAPKILMTDGLKFLRQSSSDGVEVRCGYYANLGCKAPGYNTHILLPI